jgi:hypothetical protein
LLPVVVVVVVVVVMVQISDQYVSIGTAIAESSLHSSQVRGEAEVDKVQEMFQMVAQEGLERNNRLFSFDTTRTA